MRLLQYLNKEVVIFDKSYKILCVSDDDHYMGIVLMNSHGRRWNNFKWLPQDSSFETIDDLIKMLDGQLYRDENGDFIKNY